MRHASIVATANIWQSPSAGDTSAPLVPDSINLAAAIFEFAMVVQHAPAGWHCQSAVRQGTVEHNFVAQMPSLKNLSPATFNCPIWTQREQLADSAGDA